MQRLYMEKAYYCDMFHENDKQHYFNSYKSASLGIIRLKACGVNSRVFMPEGEVLQNKLRLVTKFIQAHYK